MTSISTVSVLSPDPEKLWLASGARAVTYFCKRLPVRVDARLVDELRELSNRHDGQNVRICLHSAPEVEHHDMVILEHPGRYYRPHKHIRKGETFHIIAGRLGVLIFEEDGTVVEACDLGPGDILRVGINMFHMVHPVTDPVIYHESNPGPFLGDANSVFPDWAPDGSDPEAAAAYTDELAKLFPGR